MRRLRKGLRRSVGIPPLINMAKEYFTPRDKILWDKRNKAADKQLKEVDAYRKKYGKDPSWAEPSSNQVHGPIYMKTGKPKKGEDLQPYRNFIVHRQKTKNHMNLPASIGVVSNLEHESLLDPTIWQKGMKRESPRLEDFKGGFGFAQWEPARRELKGDRTNLRKFANERGTSISDPITQLDFIKEEMDNSTRFGNVRRKMNESNDAVQAALIFSRGYERANPNKSHDDRREAIARRLTRVYETEPGF